MFDALARFVYRRRRSSGSARRSSSSSPARSGLASPSTSPPTEPTTRPRRASRPTTWLEANGLPRHLGASSCFKGVDRDRPATRSRVEAHRARLRARPDVARVTRLLRHRLARSSSRATATRPISRSPCRPTDDKRRSGRRRSDRPIGSTGKPGVTRRRLALAQEQVNKQVESDLRRAELLAFPLLFLLSLLFFRSLVAALLPLLIGGLAIVGTFLILRIASEFGSISIFALNLITGPRARPGDRLQPVHRLPLPRGARAARRRHAHAEASRTRALGSAARHPADGRAHGAVLLADRRGRARLADRLPAALPLLDGHRRVARRADRRRRRARRAARGPEPARPARQRLAPAFLQRRADRDARPMQAGFWYRLSRVVMRRPGSDRGRERGAADRARDPVPAASSSPRSTRQVLPESASARQVDNALRADFPPFRDTPIQVAVEGGGSAPLAQDHRSELHGVPGVAAVGRRAARAAA